MAPPTTRKRKYSGRVTRSSTIGPSKPTSPRPKQRTRPTTRKTSKPSNPPPSSSSSSDESELHPTNLNLEGISTDEDNREDEEPKLPCHTTTMAAIAFPTSTHPQDPSITLENYNEVDLDIPTINRLLSASGRKTQNRIPQAIQQELKNLQFMYQRAKKLLALAAHCSEKTVNEYLQYPNKTQLLSKFSEV
ncbi:hypothetical protein DFH28DRAFT_1181282 [Melampsora americana]|nr:hypothetical protein DFH28DRAFT_1181282 [Melampsora americana]